MSILYRGKVKNDILYVNYTNYQPTENSIEELKVEGEALILLDIEEEPQPENVKPGHMVVKCINVETKELFYKIEKSPYLSPEEITLSRMEELERDNASLKLAMIEQDILKESETSLLKVALIEQDIKIDLLNELLKGGK